MEDKQDKKDLTTKEVNDINSNTEIKPTVKKEKEVKPKSQPVHIPTNPLVDPKLIERPGQVLMSNPMVDPYKIQEQNIQQNYVTQLMIEKLTQKQQQYIPNSAIETAHVLLSNSQSSEPLTEIDKEIKLSNLTETEKFLETQYMGAYQDMLWLMDQQKIREEEAKEVYGQLYDIQNIETLSKNLTAANDPDNFYDVFDAPGTLRKSRSIATISRGFLGFERTKQVETINKSENTNIEKSEHKPGFMDKISGWRNKGGN